MGHPVQGELFFLQGYRWQENTSPPVIYSRASRAPAIVLGGPTTGFQPSCQFHKRSHLFLGHFCQAVQFCFMMVRLLAVAERASFSVDPHQSTKGLLAAAGKYASPPLQNPACGRKASLQWDAALYPKGTLHRTPLSVFTGLGIVVYTFGAPPLLMNQASLSCPHAEQPAASGDCYVEASGVNWSPANSKFHVYMFSNISYLLHICSKSMKLIHTITFFYADISLCRVILHLQSSHTLVDTIVEFYCILKKWLVLQIHTVKKLVCQKILILVSICEIFPNCHLNLKVVNNFSL